MTETQLVIPASILFGLMVFWLIASDHPSDPIPTDNAAWTREIAPKPPLIRVSPKAPATILPGKIDDGCGLRSPKESPCRNPRSLILVNSQPAVSLLPLNSTGTIL